MTVGLTALVLALVEGNAWGWGSPGILGLLALSVGGVRRVRGDRAPRARRRSSTSTRFRSRTFLGANIVAFMVSFGMLAMFFFLALYMQNILGYSPLEAGVRFLPSTARDHRRRARSPGRLADRFGPRPLMVAGLLDRRGLARAGSRASTSTRATASCVGAFVLMGLGMGLVMSPMSMAAMNAVDRTKAGVASGTLSMFRMVGGTFGVAALGALVAAVGRHDLEQSLPGVPGRRARRARRRPRLGRRDRRRAAAGRRRRRRTAFVDALGTGLTISAVAVAAAAVAAWFLISPGRPAAAAPPPPAEPAAEAELAPGS